jgi:hypothetical protein
VRYYHVYMAVIKLLNWQVCVIQVSVLTKHISMMQNIYLSYGACILISYVHVSLFFINKCLEVCVCIESGP